MGPLELRPTSDTVVAAGERGGVRPASEPGPDEAGGVPPPTPPRPRMHGPPRWESPARPTPGQPRSTPVGSRLGRPRGETRYSVAEGSSPSNGSLAVGAESRASGATTSTAAATTSRTAFSRASEMSGASSQKATPPGTAAGSDMNLGPGSSSSPTDSRGRSRARTASSRRSAPTDDETTKTSYPPSIHCFLAPLTIFIPFRVADPPCREVTSRRSEPHRSRAAIRTAQLPVAVSRGRRYGRPRLAARRHRLWDEVGDADPSQESASRNRGRRDYRSAGIGVEPRRSGTYFSVGGSLLRASAMNASTRRNGSGSVVHDLKVMLPVSSS